MGLSSDLTWRLLLGFGAIPGLSVYLMRRNLKETPRFTALAHATTGAPTTAHDDGEPPPVQQSWADTIRSYRQHPPLLQWLVAASAAWFLLDIAYYGNTLSTPLIIHAIAPHATLIENLQITLGIFTLAAMPGYLLAAVMMDRMGRKTMQVVGFGVMALCFAGIALLPQAAPPLMIFIGLYGLSYFFAEFGPNTTTFVYPAEIFPSRVRTTSHGIAAMSGKIGAFLGTLLFPNLLKVAKLPGAMWVVAVVSLMGLATSLFLPEPNGKSLEALSGDNLNL
jgi:MFS family permease